MYRQIREIVEGSRRKEIVDKRQRRLQPARERRVVGRAEERIQPDESMAAPLEPANLIAEQERIAAVPSVGDEQHHRRRRAARAGSSVD